GLTVDELVQLAAGPLVTQALITGRVDVAETDAAGVINAVASGATGLVAVAAPAQHLSYLISVQPEIKSLKDLAGKPFAISRPGAIEAVTRSIIEACRFMATHKARTIEIYQKYTGEKDMKVAGEAYDALLAMHGWGVNGGMTRKGLEAAIKLAVENGATETALPVAAMAHFHVQELAAKQIGGLAESL